MMAGGRRGVLRAGWLALAAAAMVAPLHADDDVRPLVDRLHFAIGPFAADSTLVVRLDLGPDGVSPGNDPSPGVARLVERGATWRWDASGSLDGRHGWRIGGFRVSGGASGSGSRILIADDQPLDVDARVSGRLALTAHSLAYTRWFEAGEQSVAGVGIGLVRYALATRVEGEVRPEGQPVLTRTLRYAVDAWAPVLRVAWLRRLGAHWRAGVDLTWVRKPSGALTGHAIDAGLGVEWQPLDHLGLALRYTADDLDLHYVRRIDTAGLRVRNRGPQLLFTWRL
jgi:hypothetical protein